MARMRPRVNTEKHYVQVSLATVAAGAILNTKLVEGIAASAVDAVSVREGAIVSAVYVEMWIQTDDAALGSSIITLEKLSGASDTNMTTTESAALNSYDNKKHVFYTQMGLTPPATQFPMVTIRGWFKIPKGLQRFGLQDRIMLNVHAQSNGLSICGFATYKEQY